MPEGPSILYVKDQLMPFKGKMVKEAGGYGPMPTDWIKGRKLTDILTWGKHLLFVFTSGTVRVHLMLFGELLINERKKVNRSFYLQFSHDEINGYVVKAQKLKDAVDKIYDWRVDIMHPDFNKAYVKDLVRKETRKNIGELLMKQEIFAGVGNKIRNEALYRAGIHPFSMVEKIPAIKLNRLINETVKYAGEFYRDLKKSGKHDRFKVYQQEYAADGSEVTMKQVGGRKLFFSEHRQELYT